MTRPASDNRGDSFLSTIAVVLGVFALSRVALWMLGVRFDASTLGWYFQYIDPPLLRDRLFESLLNLHSQPPGFNLVLGLALKLAPVHFAAVLHAVYLFLGAVSTICVYLLARQLGLSNRLAALLAIVFALAPSTMLYENYLFYEYPGMTLFLLGSVLLHRFATTGSRRAGVAFFFTAAALIYVRAIFQWIWLIPVFLALTRVLKLRTVAACAAIPAALILALYGKNLVMFGTPTTSSWLGMNLSRGTVFRMDPATRNALARNGTLHAVAGVGRFLPLERYAGTVPSPVQTHVPVLDVAVKSSGAANFNHLSYVTISRQLLTDSLWVIRHEPAVYLRSIRFALRTAFRPATDYFAFEQANRDKIGWYESVTNRWLLLTGRWSNGVSVTTMVAYGVAILYAMFIAWRIVRGQLPLEADTLTLLFLAFTVVYVLTISVMTEIGENHRMRFMLDPAVMMIVAVGVTRRTARTTLVALVVLGARGRDEAREMSAR